MTVYSRPQRVRSTQELIMTMGALIEMEAGVIEILLAPQEIVTPSSPLMVTEATEA